MSKSSQKTVNKLFGFSSDTNVNNEAYLPQTTFEGWHAVTPFIFEMLLNLGDME